MKILVFLEFFKKKKEALFVGITNGKLKAASPYEDSQICSQ